MTITAQEINKLRQITGAGMMDCRKALIESKGDIDEAINWLRKQGQKIAAKRSDREAKEGVVVTVTSKSKTVGMIICISCETDFVAKNEDFISFVKQIANIALENNVNTIEELSKTKDGKSSVSDLLNDKLASIGEKIELSKFEKIEAPFVASYVHGHYRIGVLVGLNEKSENAGKDIAMQIAAMNPVAIDEKDVPQEIIDREKNIILEQLERDTKMANKPKEILEKIALGKLNAFYKENTLLAQSFVKDGSKTVNSYLEEVNPSLGLTGFKRVAVGK